jgi:hypothetical protein
VGDEDESPVVTLEAAESEASEAAWLDDVDDWFDVDDDELADESDPDWLDGSAEATPYPDTTATPIPRATASPPTRPTYDAAPMRITAISLPDAAGLIGPTSRSARPPREIYITTLWPF